MRRQFVKDYLSFTKAERRAVLLLLTVTLLVFVLPYWWPVQQLPPPDKAALQALQRQMAQLKQPEAASREVAHAPGAVVAPASTAARPAGQLFYFDPNTLTQEGWKRLGIRDKTILTILHYREKGGRFRRPEDMGRVYGLLPGEYARLLPYITIAAPVYEANKESTGQAYTTYSGRRGNSSYTSTAHAPQIIEINSADTSALIALPGIGSRLANRIVHFREKLGGFYSVDQVGETYALPDSTFQQIKHLLSCDSSALRRININTADANTLKQHPYIRWNIANAIVAYRSQHGDFKSIDDLLLIAIVSPGDFRKWKPYVYVP